MRRAVVTGLGFITSIGNNRAAVLRSLRELRTGVELFSEFADPDIPVKLAGTIKDFTFPSADFEDWTWPAKYPLTREQVRPMTPNALYAYAAMRQAIDDARLPGALISNENTGLLSASGGSLWLAHENFLTLTSRGVMRCPPMSVVNSIPGSLYINLAAIFQIKGATLGFSSACSSSAHALGAAIDAIRLGRQKIVFVVGAEDCNLFSILPFASARVLSVQTNPQRSPCAFDRQRDGFVGTGGATVLVVEEYEHAQQRSAKPYAELLGWGQSSDGYNVLAPDPSGAGLQRAMTAALADANIAPDEVDYLNAHAPSTPFGDASEIAAIKRTFAGGRVPRVSSTKSLTGHGLSLAGAMEAAFCCLALQEKFTLVSAHITDLDPICDGVPIVTHAIPEYPKIALNNSSGFGGTNVSVVLGAAV